jgi:hypothetical protein
MVGWKDKINEGFQSRFVSRSIEIQFTVIGNEIILGKEKRSHHLLTAVCIKKKPWGNVQ